MKTWSLFATTMCLMMLSALFASPVMAAAELTVDDCIKCHETQPAEVAEAGAAHKEAINCTDCHTSHRPVSPNNIPACNLCHEGTDHYALESCKTCHDPHQPLEIVLTGELKAECLTCHSSQNEQMVANPSTHAEFSCNFCHADTHGATPPCTECHEPHSAEMTQNDCATCHTAHEPTIVTYPSSTQNMLCASCHSGAYDLLLATETKHRNVGCVECHMDEHKMVPLCSDCHGQPHAEGIHAKFPQCGSCHNTAHDLDNL